MPLFNHLQEDDTILKEQNMMNSNSLLEKDIVLS